MAALISAMAVTGAAGVAEARWGGHGGHGGPHHRGGYAAQELSPETQQMMEKAYNDMAPMIMELRAKQAELTAKIYGGADDKTVQALTTEVNALQARVNEARVRTQREFSRAGVPLHQGSGCWFGGRGMHRGGMYGDGPCYGPGYGYGYDSGYGRRGPGPKGGPDAVTE